MAIFKCKMCGGDLNVENGATVCECEYCGTKQTLPKLDDEKKANLYDRANHFRRNNEYDKAMSIYENILNEDRTDSEAYWSLVLCKYGIEYVEDPASHKRIPTVNRTQFTSVFADEDYKSAIEYADSVQKDIYETEAQAIDEIQKGILEISNKEEPFDVFICYKETGNDGRRTPDSVLATELYHELTREGFKVFFSRITLEDKLGTAYEPYIFAALNSSKVMVVLGTKPEYFNAVWVKNEWSRFLALIKEGKRKVLIPAYKDMDPYNLPAEFSHLQAQDMSKLGFMHDLVYGIKKITDSSEPKQSAKETVVMQGNADAAPLLKRAFMFIEDGDWQSANEYCERVLDTNPESADAYLGKLMIDLKIRNKKKLYDIKEPFKDNPNYKKCIRFGDDKLVSELKNMTDTIIKRIENNQKRYDEAADLLSQNDATAINKAKEIFQTIRGYKDSAYQITVCDKKVKNIEQEKIYITACNLAKSNNLDDRQVAVEYFEKLGDYKDSAENADLTKSNLNHIYMKINASKKDKKKALILCIFLGVFGVHKLYEGKKTLGLIYFFTYGLFLVGWIYDIIDLCTKPNTYLVNKDDFIMYRGKYIESLLITEQDNNKRQVLNSKSKFLGFRSNTPWKKVLTILFFLDVVSITIIILTINNDLDVTTTDTIITKIQGCMFGISAILIYLWFCDFNPIKFKVDTKRFVAISTAVIVGIMFLSVAIFVGTDSAKSDEYQKAYHQQLDEKKETTTSKGLEVVTVPDKKEPEEK